MFLDKPKKSGVRLRLADKKYNDTCPWPPSYFRKEGIRDMVEPRFSPL
jgi:hypothetical protein